MGQRLTLQSDRRVTNPTILLSECRADTVGPSKSTVCLPVPTLGAQAGRPCWKTEGAQLAAAAALKHLSSEESSVLSRQWPPLLPLSRGIFSIGWRSNSF